MPNGSQAIPNRGAMLRLFCLAMALPKREFWPPTMMPFSTGVGVLGKKISGVMSMGGAAAGSYASGIEIGQVSMAFGGLAK